MMSSATTKWLGVSVVLILAPLLHYVVPGAFWGRTSAALAGGLMMVFFSREAIHDERVDNLKLRAVSTAFSVSFALTLVLNWLLNRNFDPSRDFDSTGPVAWRSISAFDLIVVTMAIALALFHYWRRVDGQAELGAPRNDTLIRPTV
jgi:hypothetical protein